jgi:integrase
MDGLRYNAPHTYDNRMDAEAWLSDEKRLIDQGTWTPPAERVKQETASAITVEEYTKKLLRERDLSDGTRDLYGAVARKRIYPTLGELAVTAVTPAVVRAWWASLDKQYPTARRHAYSLLRLIMNTALEDKLITESPCRIEQKAAVERDVEALTPEELDIVAAEVHDHYRVAVYVLAWTSIRFGELIELRKKDIEDDGAVMKLRVSRGAARVGKKIVVGNTKTVRSKRPVTVPPHIAVMVRDHMKAHSHKGPEALLVTTTRGQRLSKSAFTQSLKKGYAKIGRTDLRVHDLRAVGATLAAQAGATTKELMARLGHTTPRMAMKYQMASEARDEALAEAMSKLATRQPALT